MSRKINYLNVLLSIIGFLCALCLVIYPNICYSLKSDVDLSYVVTSLIYALPLVGIAYLLPKKWMLIVIVIFFTTFSIVETAMVDLFGGYLLAGNILSVIRTNPMESSGFLQNNIHIWWKFLPIVTLSVFGILFYRRFPFCKKSVVLVAIMVFIPIIFASSKLVISYKGVLTTKLFVDTRIWNRPPYNVFYQSVNALKEQRIRKQIKDAESFNFGAIKTDEIPGKEIYILAIGESMRYDNLSLNGKYERETTPCLSKLKNLILFDDYYSTACLTMYSVPMILTRATPLDYGLNYREKSIFKPFQECGFKTYAVVNATNLLSYESYLTQGVDSLILVPNVVENGKIVSGDKTMIGIVDSLVGKNDKVFIIMQFLGNHSYYSNYDERFDVYKPNTNTCTEKERSLSDSLYVNAYDNTILYQDFILSSLIKTVDKHECVSSFTFVSDHGENVSQKGGGHGGDCNPVKTEYHVPFLFWYSDKYGKFYHSKIENAQRHKHAKINADCIFYGLCDMAGILLDSVVRNLSYSVYSNAFEEHERYVLVPDGTNIKRVD